MQTYQERGLLTQAVAYFIGSSAKIFGRILIGDNVAIGANGGVTKDVPPSAVVVGIPGHVISYKGSANDVCLTDSHPGS